MYLALFKHCRLVHKPHRLPTCASWRLPLSSSRWNVELCISQLPHFFRSSICRPTDVDFEYHSTHHARWVLGARQNNQCYVYPFCLTSLTRKRYASLCNPRACIAKESTMYIHICHGSPGPSFLCSDSSWWWVFCQGRGTSCSSCIYLHTPIFSMFPWCIQINYQHLPNGIAATPSHPLATSRYILSQQFFQVPGSRTCQPCLWSVMMLPHVQVPGESNESLAEGRWPGTADACLPWAEGEPGETVKSQRWG